MRRFLFRVFGGRVVMLYGCVSMLSVGVLAALYLSTGYAMEGYVADQVARIPWDISLLQRGEAHAYPVLQEKLRAIPGVQRLEALGFLRVRNMTPLRLEIDGQPFPVRWIVVIGASEPGLLPPDVRKPTADAQPGSADPNAPPLAQVALVAAMRRGMAAGGPAVTPVGKGSLLRLLASGESHSHDAGPDSHETPVLSGAETTVFEAKLADAPGQIERQEFNKWILEDVGSLSYLPEEAVLIAVPLPIFEKLAQSLGRMFLSDEGIHGGDAPPPYVPEVVHLIRVDRTQLVSPWQLADSLKRITPVIREVYDRGQVMSPYTYINSDLRTVVARMNDISMLVGVVTLLMAVPLLWLGWVFAKTLTGVLVLNERRLIGLALIRGIPINAIGQALMAALLVGGVGGGLAGLLIGTAVPVLAYTIAGHSMPPPAVFARGMGYFAVFLGLGVALALLSGRGMVKYVRRVTPRQAMARVAGGVFDAASDRQPWHYIAAVLVTLTIGSMKVVSWVIGRSLIVAVLRRVVSAQRMPAVLLVDSLLNFVAVPMFLFGVAGLLVWRVRWIQGLLSAMTAPFVGSLHWFVGEHMALSRQRIVGTLFVASLATSLTLLPQVAADTFYGRVLRGVRASVGGNLHIEFNLADLVEGETKPTAFADYRQALTGPLSSIRNTLQREVNGASISTVEQFVVPGVYIPGQSGLMVDVLDAPDEYMKTVYYENRLGISRALPDIIGSLEGDSLTVSQGLLHVRKVPLRKDVVLGYTNEDRPIPVQFADILSFLPGQPGMGVSQREGFVAAEVDYLNYVLASDARIITSAKRVSLAPLSSLKVLPSRVVFNVRTKNDVEDEQQVNKLTAQLPFRPQTVRWDGDERRRVSKDMFISLALENMKVFMFGGLVLALAGLTAIGLANFLAEQRTFGLLRLRGVPLPLLLRISLSMFVIPVVVGILLGTLLGGVSGYGVSQAIWDLPRIQGVASLMENRLQFTLSAWVIVLAFGFVLSMVALGFGLWPFRHTAREAIREG